MCECIQYLSFPEGKPEERGNEVEQQTRIVITLSFLMVCIADPTKNGFHLKIIYVLTACLK